MASLWEFRCYVSTRGVDEIRAWYESQSPRVQAKFLSRLKTLAGMPAHEWKVPLFKWLHGECQGLGEIRFCADNIQHRPLGFKGPPEGGFTLALCAEERGGKFVPRRACEIALRRKTEVKTDEQRSCTCWLALE